MNSEKKVVSVIYNASPGQYIPSNIRLYQREELNGFISLESNRSPRTRLPNAIGGVALSPILGDMDPSGRPVDQEAIDKQATVPPRESIESNGSEAEQVQSHGDTSSETVEASVDDSEVYEGEVLTDDSSNVDGGVDGSGQIPSTKNGKKINKNKKDHKQSKRIKKLTDSLKETQESLLSLTAQMSTSNSLMMQALGLNKRATESSDASQPLGDGKAYSVHRFTPEEQRQAAADWKTLKTTIIEKKNNGIELGAAEIPSGDLLMRNEFEQIKNALNDLVRSGAPRVNIDVITESSKNIFLKNKSFTLSELLHGRHDPATSNRRYTRAESIRGWLLEDTLTTEGAERLGPYRYIVICEDGRTWDVDSGFITESKINVLGEGDFIERAIRLETNNLDNNKIREYLKNAQEYESGIRSCNPIRITTVAHRVRALIHNIRKLTS